MNIDLEIILREAFVAGYDFRTLKMDGGKGIDCEKWIESKKGQIEELADAMLAERSKSDE